MAIKRPSLKRDPSSPNTVLVIFLVFFVLASIIGGVMAYMGYSGQEKLKEAKKDAERLQQSANTGRDHYKTMLREYRFALGFEKEGGEHDAAQKAADSEDALKPMFEDVKNMRGILNYDETKSYKQNLKDLVADLKAKNEQLRGDLASQKTRNDTNEQLLNAIRTNSKESWAKALKSIEDGNAKAREEAEKQLALMEKASKDLDALQKEKEKLIDLHRHDLEQFELERKKAQFFIAELKEKLSNANNPVIAASRPLTDPHALLLDVSTGKPLWDKPAAKITRVDHKESQVYINVGSAQGVKPQLTFTVFGPGWLGRAEKTMKGSIEVIRVLDKNSSLARVTSLYDADGVEIALNDLNRVRREGTNLMKEGDLLFNFAWGVRVVIAGPVNWTGQRTANPSPADQTRQLDAFRALLRDAGVIVEAYLDLDELRIKGDPSKARYLIRGERLLVDKDGKPERNKVINEAVDALRKEALERGMFIISAENFATVIGYRPPRSANDSEVSDFRPGVPFGGSGSRPTGPAGKDDKENGEKEKMEKN